MAFNPNATQLSQEQILQQVFNPADNSLTVDATVVATISNIEIVDPITGNSLGINADRSINADVVINASSDSIKSWTQDGTGNPIGSTSGALNVATTTLPPGAATSALQIAGNTTLTAINTTLGTPMQQTGGSVSITSLSSISTSQYSVGLTATQLTVTPLSNRKSISIKAKTTSNTDVVYIGNSSGVTTGTGYPLFNGDSIQIDFGPTNVLYAIGTSAGQTVYVLELA